MKCEPLETFSQLRTVSLMTRSVAARNGLSLMAQKFVLNVERAFGAYTEALERILGVAAGSLTLIDDAMLRTWFTPAGVFNAN